MAQNLVINGVTYNSVSSLSIPLDAGGENAVFPDTSDATAAAGDIASGKTAYVGGSKVTGTATGGGGGTYQSKTVTPSASQQNITPDTGYDALSSVTINGDADLAAGNIKDGVTIFGVEGTYEGGGGSGGGTSSLTITGDFNHVTWIKPDDTFGAYSFGASIPNPLTISVKTGSCVEVGPQYSLFGINSVVGCSVQRNGSIVLIYVSAATASLTIYDND